MQVIRSIQNSIYELRGERIMLDFDLAALYEVETKVFNQAVKRNIQRFPKDFMFQLTKEEWQHMRSQIVTSYEEGIGIYKDGNAHSVINTLKKRRSDFIPYAFTEQGVAMLSGVLNSDKAIQMNIAIIRAFVEVRRVLLQQSDMKVQLRELKERVGGHDLQLSQIYAALENLLDEKAAQRKWEGRQRIGFKK